MTQVQKRDARRGVVGVMVAALLVTHAALLGWSALTQSVTFDEYAHLPAGVSYWRYGRFEVYDLSPPLLRLMGAWPALAAGAKAPTLDVVRSASATSRHWDYADAFLLSNREHYHRLFVLGRLGMIPISCLGAWITFRWAARLHGAQAALLPCALYVFCPNILAHGSIVGTDVGTTVAMLGASFLWWRFCERRDWRSGTLAALAVLTAMLCKFTALVLWPGTILIAVVTAPRNGAMWKKIAMGYLATMGLCLVGINVAYGFEGSGQRLDSFELLSAGAGKVQAALPGGLRVPLPGAMIEGLDVQNHEIEMEGPGMLLDQTYRGSRWYYYPVALVLKLPLSTLLLVGWAVLSMAGIGARRGSRAQEKLPLLLALAFLCTAMFAGRTNLGVRYVLPMFPLLFIATGRLWVAGGRVRVTALALAGLLVVENLLCAPRYLTFFNAGGRSLGGYAALNDSNFDWGQGLVDLRAWMREHQVERVHLAYFGRVEPSVYGIEYVPLNQRSEERYVAVSSYFLVGLSHHLPTRAGPTAFVHIPFFRELREKKPVARCGGTIWVFEKADVDSAYREHVAAGRGE